MSGRYREARCYSVRMRERIALAVLVGFVLGILYASLTSFNWFDAVFLTLLGGALFLVGYLASVHRVVMVVPCIVCISFALGALRMEIAQPVRLLELEQTLGEKAHIEGRVVQEPDIRENNSRLTVEITRVEDTEVERGARVLVVAPLHTEVSYGDMVRAEGKIALPEAFESGEGRIFAYPEFLAKDGIRYQMSFARVETIGESRRNPIVVAAIATKQWYLEGLASALPEPAAGLAGGITAGDKRGLGSELSDVFRTVGLTHIIVLSGYNIMVVIGFLERLFSRAHRGVRLGSSVLVALLFALMTGLASSSVRAALMALIATAGKASGRIYLAARALLFVAFLMLVWNPYLLLYDPGYQLSILATLGLIFIAPILSERLPFLTERFGVREVVATTLGTQIAVLPLLLYTSGLLGVYALPTNVLTLVVVPYAMLLSFIAGVVGAIVGSLSVLVAFPAYLVLSYIILVAELTAKLPFAAISVPAFPLSVLVIIYIGIFVWVYTQQRRPQVAAAS